MAGVNVKILHKCRILSLGEGPVWLDDTNEWGFIDMLERKFIKVDYSTNEWREVIIPGIPYLTLSHPTTQQSRFVGLSKQDVIAFDWDNPGAFKVLASVEEGMDTRFNDGSADRSGRFWAGTMGNETVPCVVPKGQGSLYSLEVSKLTGECAKSKKAKTLPCDLSNGIDWSVDNRTMFFADSIPGVIYSFRYDATAGTLNNQQVAIDFSNCGVATDIGCPDGCSIDANNKLWVACYNGYCVCCFDVETGQLVDRIDFDSQGITSCVFGGPQLNQLFVTAANRGYENGGSVYRVDGLNTHGLLTNRVNAPAI